MLNFKTAFSIWEDTQTNNEDLTSFSPEFFTLTGNNYLEILSKMVDNAAFVMVSHKNQDNKSIPIEKLQAEMNDLIREYYVEQDLKNEIYHF